MATTADFKNGYCLRHNHDLFIIVEFQHVKPGKGAAFVRTKLKSLTNGKVLEHTFNAGVKVDPVSIERRKYQFLYKDEQGFHFMNMQDFEQIFLPEALINAPAFLKEGTECEILFDADEERALICELPNFMAFEVTYTEPGIKGDTATNTLKPATIETGAEIRVPLFVENGTVVKIDTRTGDYVERVSK